MRVRLAKLATLLGGATLLWACNAPPIVVPPPEPFALTFTSQLLTDGSGQQQTVWTAAELTPSTGAADARFFIYDLNLGAGVIQTAGPDGTFPSSPAWAGTQEDHISVYYADPMGVYSDSICLLLRVVPAGSSAPRCP
jgi:hypothetical protein